MDNLKRSDEKCLFDELGLEVAHGQVSGGNTYPLFGMITRLTKDESGEVVAEINNHIIATINIKDQERVDVLKQRAFETAIFVSTVVALEPQLKVECRAIIFGKNQAFNA